jgi:hypothetical protein
MSEMSNTRPAGRRIIAAKERNWSQWDAARGPTQRRAKRRFCDLWDQSTGGMNKYLENGV